MDATELTATRTLSRAHRSCLSDATPSAGASTVAVTGGDFHSLGADPATPGKLFAGGHQSVTASTDGAATWQETDQLREAGAMGWGITDTAVDVSGYPGLSRSTDDGTRFERINDGLPGTTDLHAFDAGGGKLYGASWTPRARPERRDPCQQRRRRDLDHAVMLAVSRCGDRPYGARPGSRPGG